MKSSDGATASVENPGSRSSASVTRATTPRHLMRRAALGDLVVKILSQYVPHVGAAVVERSVLSPRDLEDAYGFPEGQVYHVELALDQAFWMRPLPGWARYRTPISGLYLCGAGTHPGGGVSGIPGHNAAREIIRDFRRGRT